MPNSLELSEDQEATAKKFIYKKLLENQDILPSASAVELIYALNPGLKKGILPGYQLILAKTPPVTEQLMQSFRLGFKEDLQMDPKFQKALQDTIDKCERLFTSYMGIAARNRERWGIAREALTRCYSDMRSTHVKYINKALCIQLTNLISGCIIVLEGTIAKNAISEKDEESIIDLCHDLSFIFPTDRLRIFFRENPVRSPVAMVDGQVLRLPEEELTGGEYVSSGPSASVNNDFPSAWPPPDGGLRSFRVSVHLRKENNIVTDGPDITGRYRVTFYARGLENYKALHLGCHGLATYSSISLAAAYYGMKVYDLRENRECIVIGSEIIDTRNIKLKAGYKNYEIQIFVDDKAGMSL